MKTLFAVRWPIAGLAFFAGAVRVATASTNPSDAAGPYLNAVRVFADNVLALGTDRYGPESTPLFVDGIDVDTHEPVKWKSRGGREWVLCNFASQQNLLRTLDGLTALTGKRRYREAGVAATRYALDHLMRNGLLCWGGHSAYNAGDARLVGDNILQVGFNGGLFVARDRQFASFDRVEPLTLLHLAAALAARTQGLPAYPGGTGFYSADYGSQRDQRDSFIYTLPRRARPTAP